MIFAWSNFLFVHGAQHIHLFDDSSIVQSRRIVSHQSDGTLRLVEIREPVVFKILLKM
jgi:hypothetical protein